MLFNVLDLFKEAWFIIVFSVAVILLAIGFIILFAFLLVRNSSRRQIKELETRYNLIHDTFSTDCSNMIKRIETISKHNASYVQIFESVQERFSKILTNNDKECYISVDSLKKLIDSKEYKGIKNIIDSTKESMNDFDKEAIQLSNDLQDILKQEEECRSMSVALKEKLRKLKTDYDDNATALESLAPSFGLLFDHISAMFSEFEDQLTCADYKGAKDKLPEIEMLIDAASKVMQGLPYLNTLADKVIPGKIKELTDTYIEMENEDYPLHHLLLKSSIEDMNKQVAECKQRLACLSIKGVEECFNVITMKINEYFGDFQKEKEAKIEFDSKQGMIANLTYQSEKQFANLRNALPSYKEVYKIDSTYLEQINAIKDMIEDMSNNKRTLDSYINSSTKQPYSMLVTTMSDLQEKIDKVQKAFDDFHEYLKQLKIDTDRSFAFVRESYEKLKECEYQLKKINIDALSDVMAPRIQKGYDYIFDIDHQLNVAPIDVMVINSKYNEAAEHLKSLYGDIKEAITFEANAENCIVYDNIYREDSLEVRQGLQTAEKSFLEADFTRAANIAMGLFKKQQARK
jgi:septation ring formation regulator